jgi:adenylate cyclase
MLAFAARVVLGEGQPQLVLIEDLHWADAGTEEFIAQLAQGVSASRSVLLLNTRPAERPAWLPAGTLEIRLDELAGEDLGRFLSALLGDADGLRETRQHLLAQTRGNPFFIQEAVRHLSENGFLVGAPGDYRPGRAGDAWQIPDSVHALIAARLDRLPDASKRVLQAAAVAGLRFERVQLSWLVESTEAALDPLLQSLERGGFLEAHASSWRFAHPLIQEVAYRTQLEGHRREAHRRLAAELDRHHPPEGAPHRSWITAAHHWTGAGEWERAGTAHLHVARWLGGADPAGAAAAFRRAAAALDQAADSSEVLRDRIAARSGILLQLQLQPLPVAEVEQIFKEAQQLALKTRNLSALGELFIAYTIALLQRGDAAAAKRLMADVVNQAIATGAGASVARFRMTVLLVCTWAGFPREGLALVDKATGEAWQTDPVTQDNFVSRGFLAFMQCWLGELAPARANILAAAAFGAAEDGTAWLDAFHADHAWLSGETAGVLEKVRAAARRAQSYGAPLIVTITQRSLALALIMAGEADQAISVLKSQLPAVAPGAAAHHCEGILLTTLAMALARAGREAEAAETAERALASAQRQKTRLWEALAWLALLDLRSLAPERASEGLARVETLLDEIGAEGLRPWWWLARERWSPAFDRTHCREQALAAFERIGATGHLARLREPKTAA